MAAPVLQFKRGNAGVAGTVPALRPGEPAISLNNFDFFIGIDTSVANNKFFGSHRYWEREDGTESLKLKLVDSNGTNSINLKSPDTLSGITTLILPGTQGDPNSVLTNDGSGNLSWVSGLNDSVFTGITTFSDTTESTTSGNGAVQILGGLGVAKSVNIGGNFGVSGTSTFYGTVTFEGGTINIGNEDSDSVVFAADVDSNIIPNTDDTYDLGASGKRWRNINLSGIITATEIDASSGLITAGSLQVNGDSNFDGNVTITDKDIVVANTLSPTDNSANHGGIAIASDEGTPLISMSVAGINTLPDTYKQLMWVKSGTFSGLGTDAFIFNYGVGIGSTQFDSGVRLAVGGVQITDDTITATTGSFENLTGTLTGTISTATRAQIVDTTATSDDSAYYIPFVTNSSSTTGETIRVDGDLSYNPSTNKLTVGGDLQVSGNDIQASDGNTNITMTSNTLTTFAGDVKVSGNDIQASDNSVALTFSSSDVTVGGDLTVGGNDIKSGDGTTALTLADSTGAVTAASDLTVNGNLYVSGNTTQVNTAALTVEDRTIDLGIVNGAAPASATTWDLGVLFNYHAGGSAKKSAVVWEHGDTRFKFASVLSADTNGTNNDTPQLSVTTFAPIEIGALWVNDCAGQSQVISCTGSERYLENITVDAGTF
jgi:hypothetical protein